MTNRRPRPFFQIVLLATAWFSTLVIGWAVLKAVCDG